MKRVRLADRASRDLVRAFQYSLRHFGHQQAVRYVEDLRARVMSLADNPLLGKPSESHPNKRRLVHKKHIIHYRLSEESIIILRILDARQKPLD